MAAMRARMAVMGTGTRRRIHLTETPRLAAIIERNAVPGESRAATVTRLVERADCLTPEPELMVFHAPAGQVITIDDVNGLLADDDLTRYQEVAGA